tara:strand:- start:1446 stop:2276 length:831 start_codon:yes stop_codon:yes gene_type:complete
MKLNKPLSATSLKEFGKSPAHLIAYQNKVFETSDAKELGSLIHTLILEPDEFDTRYFCLDEEEILLDLAASGAKSPRATKVYKDWKAEELIKAGDKIMLTPEVLRVATTAALKAQDLPIVQAITLREEFIEWEFNEAKFRGYVDGAGLTLPLELQDFPGQGFIIDVKTTRDASPKAFARDVFNMDYHLQAALYCNGNKTLNFAGPDPKFFLLAIETKEPFNCQLYEVTPDFLFKGEMKAEILTDRYKDWDGEPYGYDYGRDDSTNGVIKLSPPAWS